MQNISHIMCVIDPTSDPQPAMERAAWLAGKTGAELELFICYYNEYLNGERLFDSPSLEKARQEIINGQLRRLETLAEPLRNKGIVVKTTAVWDHPLHEGIVRHAAAVGAHLVFKDTHHHSAIARTLLTNTDWNLIRTCAAPLWLVKPRELPEKSTLVAALDPLHAHDKPAELDDEILDLTRILADATGAELRAFHSYDPGIAISSATANVYVPTALPLDDLEKQLTADHKFRFHDVVKKHGIDTSNAHLVSGLVHEELPEFCRKFDATAVVMGAVSRNRLRRLFIGATAERTLDHLPCDLLIVKPNWFRIPEEISKERAA